MIGLEHYLTVAAALFVIGIFGIFLNRKNVIVILMSVELILLAVNINLVAFATYLNDVVGQVFALFSFGGFQCFQFTLNMLVTTARQHKFFFGL